MSAHPVITSEMKQSLNGIIESIDSLGESIAPIALAMDKIDDPLALDFMDCVRALMLAYNSLKRAQKAINNGTR